MTKKIYRDRTIMRNRILYIFLFFLLIFFALSIRLSYIMVTKSPEYKEKAINQWTSIIKVAPKRGKILDKNGNELAVSADVYRVDLDMNTLRKYIRKSGKTKNEIAKELSLALNMEEEEIIKILNKKINGKDIASAILKRRIEKKEADDVRKLEIDGVIVSGDTKRYYPNENFLSHVIGHTNSDGYGLTGVELIYDKYLYGKEGKKVAETDSKRKELPYSIAKYEKPIDGYDLVLTVDQTIQHFAEKAANKALNENKAKAVTIMVMDPKSGEILALANKPDYNPNNPWREGLNYEELQKIWRNRAVSDTFEPGSIFKVITATSALEEGVVNENTTFQCNGSIKIGNRNINCWKRGGHGTQTFGDIIKNSCNVGFVQLGEKIGISSLNKCISKFGFGQKTGIDLNGEATGIIKPTNKVTKTDLATIAFGQTNTVTSVQYMAAFNTVANGGKWITPHVMKKIVSNEYDKEKIIKKYDSYNEKNIVDGNIAGELRGYLEKVVSEGGANNAFIDGYHIGGKTGTAQKVVNGRYGAGKYISSFAGMAPCNDPKITVLVSIDEPDPSNYYAAQTAAPIAKQLFYDIFNYLALKPDVSGENVAKSMLKDVIIPEVRGFTKNQAIKVLTDSNLKFKIEGNGEYIQDINPKPGYSVKEGTEIILYSGSSTNYNNKEVIIPDLLGMTKESAERLLNSLGLKITIEGNGIVSNQSKKPGEKVSKGDTINVTLSDNID